MGRVRLSPEQTHAISKQMPPGPRGFYAIDLTEAREGGEVMVSYLAMRDENNHRIVIDTLGRVIR